MSRMPVQALWVGTELPRIAQIAICSFMEHGHPYHLYVYDKVKYVPKGCIVKDANTILARKYIYRTEISNSLACFSDWFRYELLLKKGGYYVDTDIVCLRPFEIQDDFLVAEESHPSSRTIQDGSYVNGAVIKVPAGHPVMRIMCWCCRVPYLYTLFMFLSMMLPGHLGLPRRARWTLREIILKAASGYSIRPSTLRASWGRQLSHKLYRHIVMMYIKRTGQFTLIAPQHHFYPVVWGAWHTLGDDTYANEKELFTGSYGVHLWCDMMPRDISLGTGSVFHSDSVIERLARRHLPSRT